MSNNILNRQIKATIHVKSLLYEHLAHQFHSLCVLYDAKRWSLMLFKYDHHYLHIISIEILDILRGERAFLVCFLLVGVDLVSRLGNLFLKKLQL